MLYSLKYTAAGVGGMNGALAAPPVESASVDVTVRETAPGHLQMVITALGTVSTWIYAWIFSVHLIQQHSLSCFWFVLLLCLRAIEYIYNDDNNTLNSDKVYDDLQLAGRCCQTGARVLQHVERGSNTEHDHAKTHWRPPWATVVLEKASIPVHVTVYLAEVL